MHQFETPMLHHSGVITLINVCVNVAWRQDDYSILQLRVKKSEQRGQQCVRTWSNYTKTAVVWSKVDTHADKSSTNFHFSPNCCAYECTELTCTAASKCERYTVTTCLCFLSQSCKKKTILVSYYSTNLTCSLSTTQSGLSSHQV